MIKMMKKIGSIRRNGIRLIDRNCSPVIPSILMTSKGGSSKNRNKIVSRIKVYYKNKTRTK